MTDCTKAWIRNKSDELAAGNGCWFDPLAGGWVVWWIERHCKLYEGEFAGTPLVLRGAHSDPIDLWPIPDDYDEGLALERAEHYAEKFAAGEPCDWQYECVMRMFSWKKRSDRWGRDIRRFRRASIWVPKKNKKSPSLAALALYLTCGDDEQGQKVFFGAKDGSQARDIMGEHVRAMYEQSEELMEICDFNKNKMRISDRETRSFMQPMSSSDSRTKESKEGINGSVMIDETHVVDRDFIRRIKRAGISRAEPFQIEVSTAGTNPDGYGKEQFDYGKQVASGDAVDEALFYQAYAAPQEASDADVKADPLKFGMLANPAWGHTIGKEEFLGDFAQSQRKETEWLDFKMYRLNIWQNATNPWLPAGAWEKCREFYAESDLDGEYCIGGMDLSSARDFSAWTLLFPEWGESGIDRARLLTWIWATEKYVEDHQSDAPFLDWVNSGELIVCEGERIDVGYIYRTVAECSERYNVAAIGYDPYNAEPLTQLIAEGAVDQNQEQLSEGLGIERFVVNQQGWQMGAAADEFESMVVDGRVQHNGHSVFDWMIGNVNVKESNGRTRLVKPERKSVRKIDGPVSAVIALATALQPEFKGEQDWYKPGQLAL